MTVIPGSDAYQLCDLRRVVNFSVSHFPIFKMEMIIVIVRIKGMTHKVLIHVLSKG